MNSPRFSFLQAAVVLAGLMSCCTTVVQAQAQALPDKPVVSGTFLGNGKDAKIQYLVVQAREPFSDQAAIRLIFTEKNPSSSKKPDFDAGFKKLGSALILSVFKDGGIFGCEVAHTALPKSPFSAIGEIKMKDFKVTETHVSGHVSTGGELDAFGQKWNVDLTFSAPLPKGAFAGEVAPAPEKKMAEKDESEEKPEEGDAGPKVPVADLPLPATARDVEYKAMVEQITLNADGSVSTVANEYSAKLKVKGWKEMPGGLVSKMSAILKRKLGGAELTIMINPAPGGSGKGCTVKVFAEGLDWTVVPKSTATSGNKPAGATAAPTDAEVIEAEANKILNDALKGIPKF